MCDCIICTGFSSQIGTKLHDWAVGQAWAAASLGLHCSLMTQRPGTTTQNEMWSRFGKLFFCEFP